MIIEKVKSAEYGKVMEFYYAVIDGFEGMPLKRQLLQENRTSFIDRLIQKRRDGTRK